jgi:predicted dehydrogenase
MAVVALYAKASAGGRLDNRRVTVQVGVVGCGWWATHAHLPALERNPDAAIAALADVNEANLCAAAARFAVGRTFSSAEAMFAEARLDGAIVAVPHAAHFDVARAALEHRAHVLVEKPLTIRSAEAFLLVETAADVGRELVVGYPWHYNRHAIALREAIGAGRNGRLEFASCLFASTARELYRGNPAAYSDVLGYSLNAPSSDTYSDPAVAGGGQGQTQVTHSAALLLFLTGLQPTQVAAFMDRFELGVDLVDAAAVRFREGVVATLASTGSILPGQREILDYQIFGDDGHIVFRVNDGSAVIHGPNGFVEELPALPIAEQYPDGAPADNLVDLCLGRGANGSPGQLGASVVELIEGMYRSAETGEMVSLGGSP